jgi:hypothetical protein
MARPKKVQLTSPHSPLPLSTLRITSVTGMKRSIISSGAPQEGRLPGGRLWI